MSVQIATKSGLIDIGATKLYHEVRGSGPTLLLISGGTGDAGDWAPIVPPLAEKFTVVTYDRRGFSRSPRPEGWSATSMGEQADDAAALLRALDLAPATVVGHSGGGSIACSLVARHPELLRHALFYEPPLVAVVPDREEISAGFLAVAEQARGKGGPRRAMEQFMRSHAGDELYETFAALDPAGLERCLDNGAVFFQIELMMFGTYLPDLERMRASGVPLTVAAGRENRDSWYGAAARWLAQGAGAELVELPGGHVGYISNPEEFLALVRRVAGG
jgi:pimeloyl-ACP methyl ester carboxylesterase